MLKLEESSSTRAYLMREQSVWRDDGTIDKNDVALAQLEAVNWAEALHRQGLGRSLAVDSQAEGLREKLLSHIHTWGEQGEMLRREFVVAGGTDAEFDAAAAKGADEARAAAATEAAAMEAAVEAAVDELTMADGWISTSAHLQRGTFVEIHGLTKNEHLNGSAGRVEGEDSKHNGRWRVRLQDGRLISLQRERLVVRAEAEGNGARAKRRRESPTGSVSSDRSVGRQK